MLYVPSGWVSPLIAQAERAKLTWGKIHDTNTPKGLRTLLYQSRYPPKVLPEPPHAIQSPNTSANLQAE